MTTPPPLARPLLAELLACAFLAAVLIGSGIAAQQLSPNDVGVELLENPAEVVIPHPNDDHRQVAVAAIPNGGAR